MHELGSIYSLTKYKRHFSVMASKPDYCASNLGSIPGQVNFLENFILLNSSKIRRELWKKLDWFKYLNPGWNTAVA